MATYENLSAELQASDLLSLPFTLRRRPLARMRYCALSKLRGVRTNGANCDRISEIREANERALADEAAALAEQVDSRTVQ